MEKFTKEFYLENRKKTKFQKQILFSYGQLERLGNRGRL